jgi:hypothetical protein
VTGDGVGLLRCIVGSMEVKWGAGNEVRYGPCGSPGWWWLLPLGVEVRLRLSKNEILWWPLVDLWVMLIGLSLEYIFASVWNDYLGLASRMWVLWRKCLRRTSGRRETGA